MKDLNIDHSHPSTHAALGKMKEKQSQIPCK